MNGIKAGSLVATSFLDLEINDMYSLIIEEYNLEMPHELSSTDITHQDPKYKLV